MEQPVFLHNMSVLKSRDPPEWVVYQEVYEVQVKIYTEKWAKIRKKSNFRKSQLFASKAKINVKKSQN